MKVIIFGILLLTGCATCPEPKELIKIERIVVKPPSELLTIPSEVFPIDVDKATQRTVADWILKKEERSFQLEEKLKAIAKFYQEIK